jgi:hypothetical protein
VKTLWDATAEFYSGLRQVTLGESSPSWATHCIVVAKLGVLISVGLGVSFAIGIALGLGVETTPLKLISAGLMLIVWPVLMGLTLGTVMFLAKPGRGSLGKLFSRLRGRRS